MKAVPKLARDLAVGEVLIVWFEPGNVGAGAAEFPVEIAAPTKDWRDRDVIHVKSGDRTFKFRPSTTVYVRG